MYVKLIWYVKFIRTSATHALFSNCFSDFMFFYDFVFLKELTNYNKIQKYHFLTSFTRQTLFFCVCKSEICHFFQVSTLSILKTVRQLTFLGWVIVHLVDPASHVCTEGWQRSLAN